MSSKTVKAALKDAREAIKNKEYQIAIKKCKEAIKEDKENYMAFVMLGAAYQETDKKEAAKALKIALKFGQDHSLAYQGLANCAESEDLPEIYGKLLLLTPDRFQDLHQKLVSIAAHGNPTALKSIAILSKEVEEVGTLNERVKSAWRSLSEIFLKLEDLDEKFSSLYENALEKSLEYKNTTNIAELATRYLKLLHKLKKLDKLIASASQLHAEYPNNVIYLEWICKIYGESKLCDLGNVKTNLINPDISYYIDCLLAINSQTTLGLLAKALSEYEQKNYAAAKNILIRVNELQPNWGVCLKLMLHVYELLKSYSSAEIVYRQLKIVDLKFIECLAEQNKKEKSGEILKIASQLLEGEVNAVDQKKIDFVVTKAYVLKENCAEADQRLTKFGDVTDVKWQLLTALHYRLQSKIEQAIQVLTSLPETPEVLLELGKCNFAVQKLEAALINVLKATKQEPHNSECFYWLGKIYLASADETRAKKCFEKCLNLNPQNEQAIICLSTIYRRNGEWDSNLTLLENSVKSVEGQSDTKFAYLQLGLHHLSRRNFDDAIGAFRSALRYDVNDTTIWEGLADAYFSRGSFHSALKVYEKTMELQPSSTYAKLQVATVKTILRLFTEAIELFEDLLKIDPKYLPAIKGIAEAHSGLSAHLHSQRLLGRARDHAQHAVTYLADGIKLKPNLICLWRLLAYILDAVASYPHTKAYLIVPGALAGEEVDSKVLQGDKLFELAARCYSRAIKLSKDDSYLWHELALTYYHRTVKYPKTIELDREYLRLASEAAKYCIKLLPSRWQNWNLLGVICTHKDFENLPLAQHCFIKSVTIDKGSAVAWTNLGVLYMLQSQIQLANKAFGRSQQSDTNFVEAWVGQALIAEQIGQNDESVDLFRHCTQLDFHIESSIGYPHWVCSILNEPDYRIDAKHIYAIDNMYAVPVALDSIVWHCGAEDTEASLEAWCFLGYLNAKQNLWISAVKAFQKALVKAEGQTKDKILCDLGYSLLKLKKPLEAIQAFNSVTEATFKATVGLALAHFKAKQFQESYSVYESVLQWLASSETEKSLVLVAMSAMVYAFQGETDAKTVLFQCMQQEAPPVEALFSACSLGILHKDVQLSELVIQELKKYEYDAEHGHHVAFLISQFYLLQNETKLGLNYLIGKVHAHPHRAQLRKVLANYLLKNYKKTFKNYLRVASRIAQSSITLGLADLSKSQSSLEAAKSLAVASEAMRSVDLRARKVLAQKAVHAHPTCNEAWSALMLSKAC